MVTKESFIKAKKEQDIWRSKHPDASMKKRIVQSAKATKGAFEIEIGLHTLPSLFVPMPEESAKKLKKIIGKKR